MTTKHTPGPWRITGEKQTDRGRMWGINGTCIPVGMSRPVDCRLAEVFSFEANARLIAAAPRMLSALELALFGVTKDYEVNGEIDRHAIVGVLREAIALATGENDYWVISKEGETWTEVNVRVGR